MNGELSLQFKMLNDIAKMAAIKATSALSKILEFPIGVDIIPVEKKRLQDINDFMKPTETVVGLNIPIVGPMPGMFLLIYPENAAFAICDAMFHRKDGETKAFTDMDVSALTEVANIVAGNFLTSLALPLKIDSLLHRAAQFSRSSFASFIEEVSKSHNKDINEGLLVEIAFYFQHIKIQGLAVFLFDEKTVAAVINKAKI